MREKKKIFSDAQNYLDQKQLEFNKCASELTITPEDECSPMECKIVSGQMPHFNKVIMRHLPRAR